MQADAHVDDAGDARACDYTGEPPGTVSTLWTLGDGGIEDFDVDCDGVVVATSQGGILSCPVSGCTAPPAVVAPAGTYAPQDFQVRIGAASLFVTSATVPQAVTADGGPAAFGPSDAIYSQPRTGGPGSVAASLDTTAPAPEPPSDAGPVPATCKAIGFGTSGSLAYYAAQCNGPIVHPHVGGDGIPHDEFWAYPGFFVLAPQGDGAATETWLPVSLTPTEGPEYTEVSVQPVSGSSYFAFGALVSNDGGLDRGLVRFELGASPAAGAIFADEGFVSDEDKNWQLVATDSFVIWDKYGLVYACPSGASCATPTAVSGIDLEQYDRVGALHDTLFLSPVPPSMASFVSTGVLATCEASALLAGSCAPSTLAQGLPPFTRLVATSANVYLLTSSGILRIAR